MFLTIYILPFIATFVIDLLSFSVRVLASPLTFVLQISVLVGIDSLVGSCPHKIAAIVVHVYALVQVRLEMVINFPLKKPTHISALS